MGTMVSVGVVLAGKYRIERRLGVGGMGYVMAARHLELDEDVALKFLLPAALAIPELVARFRREARAAVKIKSEHVCRVLDVASSDEFGPYMVMELLHGEDLGTSLRRRGPLPWREAVGYVLQALVALAEAHARGIVHRDLKPSNLFVSERSDGSALVKLLDFGISKIVGDVHGELTATATPGALGSYAYMSPEQARNAKDVDGRADIWAIGVLLHKLAAGRGPFEAQTASEYIAKIVADEPAPLRWHAPDAPVDLEAIVLRCLRKDRSTRYATVAELAAALAPLVPDERLLCEKIARVGARTEWRTASVRTSDPQIEPTPSGAHRATAASAASTVPRAAPSDPRASAPGATPFPHGATPLPHGATPLPHGATPLPLGATPRGATPLPLGATPLPLGATPLPLGTTPLGTTPLGATPGATPLGLSATQPAGGAWANRGATGPAPWATPRATRSRVGWVVAGSVAFGAGGVAAALVLAQPGERAEVAVPALAEPAPAQESPALAGPAPEPAEPEPSPSASGAPQAPRPSSAGVAKAAGTVRPAAAPSARPKTPPPRDDPFSYR
jgi:serine/threonine-protein kinase